MKTDVSDDSDRPAPSPAVPAPNPSDSAGSRAFGTDVIDSVDLPIIVVGRDLAVESFNPAAAKLFSLTTSAVGRSLHAVRMLAEITDLKERCVHALDGASSQREVRDGAGSWFFLRIAPYTGNDQIAGAVLTFANVTAFRASLDQAIYEREYTKAILNTVIDPLVVLDDDCRVQVANQAFYAMFQVSRDQAQGVRLYELGSRDWDLSRLRRLITETETNNQSDALEFEHEFPTIGHRTVWLNARHLSRQGDLREMTLLTIQDITERKQGEEALRKSEEQFRRAIEQAPIPIIMQAEDGEVLQISQTWTGLTGYTLDDASILRDWMTQGYSGGGEQLRAAIQKLISAEASEERMVAVDVEIVTRTGERRTWSLSASSPGTLRDGRRFIVGMALDVTERKQAEADREKLVEQLQTERERLKCYQAQLQEKITDLERFHDVVVGRELKLMELEKDNQDLRSRLKDLEPKLSAFSEDTQSKKAPR